jgi:hypothetical protein
MLAGHVEELRARHELVLYSASTQPLLVYAALVYAALSY